MKHTKLEKNLISEELFDNLLKSDTENFERFGFLNACYTSQFLQGPILFASAILPKGVGSLTFTSCRNPMLEHFFVSPFISSFHIIRLEIYYHNFLSIWCSYILTVQNCFISLACQDFVCSSGHMWLHICIYISHFPFCWLSRSLVPGWFCAHNRGEQCLCLRLFWICHGSIGLGHRHNWVYFGGCYIPLC